MDRGHGDKGRKHQVSAELIVFFLVQSWLEKVSTQDVRIVHDLSNQVDVAVDKQEPLDQDPQQSQSRTVLSLGLGE